MLFISALDKKLYNAVKSTCFNWYLKKMFFGPITYVHTDLDYKKGVINKWIKKNKVNKEIREFTIL